MDPNLAEKAVDHIKDEIENTADLDAYEAFFRIKIAAAQAAASIGPVSPDVQNVIFNAALEYVSNTILKKHPASPFFV